jgi:hypothetical protein
MLQVGHLHGSPCVLLANALAHTLMKEQASI